VLKCCEVLTSTRKFDGLYVRLGALYFAVVSARSLLWFWCLSVPVCLSVCLSASQERRCKRGFAG
jgi:hypothetical protein